MAGSQPPRAHPPEVVDVQGVTLATPLIGGGDDPRAPSRGAGKGAHEADTLIAGAAGKGAREADTLIAGASGKSVDEADTLVADADTLRRSPVDEDADTLAAPRVRGGEVDVSAPTLAVGARAGAAAAAPARSRGRADEPATGEVIGRYVILSRLGAGGMGVVYAAYDPELDRKIALKLLRDPRGGVEARARLVREAQAMAQLAHPNVVAVHDVGTVGDRVYVAMEFVAGETLTSWIERSPRSWQEILRVLLAAGDGLQAAHEAGLVHRDFKPDNVMVGDDGRARVMDFGLARAGQGTPPLSGDATRSSGSVQGALTQVGAVMGTPRYMAPEQWGGAETDARTDQFALCVTLWEALYGAPPFAGETFFALAIAVSNGDRRPPPANASVPAWLRRVIDRGLRPAPAERWPSTEALLAALRDDPTPRRRWWGAAAIAVLGVSATLIGVRVEREREVAGCEARAAMIDTSWNDAKRSAIREGFLGIGASFAERSLTTTSTFLDGIAEEWRETERASCLATRVEESQSPEVGEGQEACLDERRAEIDALVEILEDPDVGAVTAVTTVMSQFRRPATCLDADRLGPPLALEPAERARALEIRRSFARIQALTRIARHEEAQALLDALLPEVDALGVPELRARARTLQCDISEETGDYTRARDAAEEAMLIAGSNHADEIAAFAAVDLAVIVGLRFRRAEEGLLWSRLADMWLDRAGIGEDLRRSRALVARGTILLEVNDLDGAEVALRRSLEIRERILGPDNLLAATSLEALSNIDQMRGDGEAARVLYDRALTIRETILGPDHPDVGIALTNRAIGSLMVGDYQGAISDGRRALMIAEATMGADHLFTGAIHNNLGRALVAVGKLDEAAHHFYRVVEIYGANLGADHHEVAYGLTGLGDLALGRGDLAAARALHGRGLALREAGLSADHPYIAYSAVGIGEAMLCGGELLEAIPMLERALAVAASNGDPDLSQRIARALADALAGTGGDEGRIAELRAAAGERASACVPELEDAG